MPPDFTYEMYGRLLDAGLESGVPFITVREYLTAESLPPGFVILRHDVDRKPQNALDFAHIEAERGIRSTYYFRTVDKTFLPELIREVESLGHEVGYHYEDVDRADGDLDAAHASFERELARIREVATVDTICMHGRPLTPHDNRDMWTVGPGFGEYGIEGEAYLSMDFTDVMYYSDTGRTWRDGALKVKDYTIGEDEKSTQVGTTEELIALVRADPDSRYCLLTHPDRWAGTSIERVSERVFDGMKNATKYVMHVFSSL